MRCVDFTNLAVRTCTESLLVHCDCFEALPVVKSLNTRAHVGVDACPVGACVQRVEEVCLYPRRDKRGFYFIPGDALRMIECAQ
jgi:hypothetical protein